MKKILLTCLMLVLVLHAWAQNRTVSGTVTDAKTGDALPGVNVLIKGTGQGVNTDIDGSYKLSVPEGSTLVFTFIGMAPTEEVVGGRSVIDVTMSADVKQLSEVVVTALGISKEKRAIGYSVQGVDGDDLAESKEPNVINSLQGSVAGVQIQGTSNGALGGSSRITIRGSNSFLGQNQPLFVVDGMPINNDSYASDAQQAGFGGGSYDYGNAASDINPNDIASMQVLKGAAATALYGTRGSNGVILITTKSAKQKKGIGVEVNSSLTFEDPIALLEHQQNYGGGAMVATSSGFTPVSEGGETFLTPVYSKDGAWGPRYNPNVQVRHWDSWDPGAANYGETRPWVAPANDYSEFFETGQTWQNSVAVSGANDQGNFRLSYSNLDQAGIMPNSEMQRNTVSFNVNYNLTDRFKAFAAGSLVTQDASGRSVTGYNNANPMQAFTQWWQTQIDVTRLKDNYVMSDGSQYTWNATGPTTGEDGTLAFNSDPYFFDNPYWVREFYLQEDRRDRFYGNMGFNYEIIDGLNFQTKLMRDGFTYKIREGVPKGLFEAEELAGDNLDAARDDGVEQSDYTEITRTFNETNLEAKLSYSTAFSEDVSLDVILGGNIMSQTRTRVTNSANGGLALSGFFNLGNSIGNPSIGTDVNERQINSVFATSSLGLFYTVFVDLAVRGDWSSTLPEGSNNYWYPSVTTSFVFSELPFLQENDIISFGKLRAGYGTAANDADPYSLRNTYINVQPNFGSSPRYRVPNSRNNPDLKPEFTNEFELGLEMNFFQNRLGFDVTYYDRVTRDQIFNVASSATTGFTSRLVNAGSMRNSGIELMLNATPVSIGDFSWDITANFATFNNEVVELNEDIESIVLEGSWAADVRLEEGKPYMAIYGQKWQRNENGDILIDEAGSPIATENREFLGSAVADFTGGLRNTFRYKGLSLSALFDFQKGGAIHSTSLQWAAYSGMTQETAVGNVRERGMVIEGVTEGGTPNETAIDPQAFWQANFGVAEPHLYDASYVKFRELKLNYTIPNRFLGNLPIRDLSVGFLGRNMAILFSNLPYLDPQGSTGAGNIQGLENAQVPSTRSLGFNIGFKL